jgi:4'-phosphopantetheinyl transferase EntD
VIDEILSAPVSCAEAFSDPPDTWLYPEEAAIVANAVDKRRREFSTGRDCARNALRRLGLEPGPILTGERGAPLWPPGIVGSITHCAGYQAAAVARASDTVTIGLDAEPNETLPDGVLDLVSLPSERRGLGDCAGIAPGICWDRLLFSTKETVYKAWFPLAGRWLGFEEAEITFSAAEGTFAARLLVPGLRVGGRELTGFTGRWLVRDGLLLTALAVPAA